MKIPPPRIYTEEHLKILFEDLDDKKSYLAEFLKNSKFDSKTLYNLMVKQSHSQKYNSHTKNLIRSIRCVMWDVATLELPLWTNESEPEIKSVIKWRLSIVG